MPWNLQVAVTSKWLLVADRGETCILTGFDLFQPFQVTRLRSFAWDGVVAFVIRIALSKKASETRVQLSLSTRQNSSLETQNQEMLGSKVLWRD
jgi:hypothetical protein